MLSIPWTNNDSGCINGRLITWIIVPAYIIYTVSRLVVRSSFVITLLLTINNSTVIGWDKSRDIFQSITYISCLFIRRTVVLRINKWSSNYKLKSSIETVMWYLHLYPERNLRMGYQVNAFFYSTKILPWFCGVLIFVSRIRDD